MSNGDGKLGAWYHKNGRCDFELWAPLQSGVDLVLFGPEKQTFPMTRDDRGYWRVSVEAVTPGTRYAFSIGGASYPDPASAFQPEGVHKPSAVYDQSRFTWSDEGWEGVSLDQMIVYELHVGTFSAEGTFEGAAQKLPELAELGINAIELMPFAQFPGDRNWGYDGVHPYAVQNSYGGPDGLKSFVDQCHRAGFAVIFDVVYNHLGPEGNYLQLFAPYFSEKYHTPWGKAINFDDADSDEVRRFFIQNALYWLEYFHADALRLDAVHAILDMSAYPFLHELQDVVAEWCTDKRPRYLIAESDLGDSRIIRPPTQGGFGLPAQWCDDFHHALHALITGEQSGYYADFGRVIHLQKSMAEAFVYTGEYSRYRRCRHGNSAADLPASRFVVFCQNHDQVGNRPFGERLWCLTGFERLKLAAATVLLSPYIPLLFMGEEYGESAPFLYFVSVGDPALAQAISKGRKADCGGAEIPDPQSPETFSTSRLRWQLRDEGTHRRLYSFYKKLIAFRTEIPALAESTRRGMEVFADEEEKFLFFLRSRGKDIVACLFNFEESDGRFPLHLPEGRWRKLLDSADEEWGGPGAAAPMEFAGADAELQMKASSVVVYRTELR